MSIVYVRKSERGAIRRALPLACQVVSDKRYGLIAERSFDLSQEGMRVACEAGDVGVGDVVHVSFRATAFSLWFHTSAEVTRVLQGNRKGDRGRSLGLRFTSLDCLSRLILRGNLRKIPPPIPQRPQRIDYMATLERMLAEGAKAAA